MKFTMTYRTRKRLRSFGIGLLCVTLAAVLVWAGWLVWLGRYAVYADGRVYFDFDRQTTQDAQEVLPTEPQNVQIQFHIPEENTPVSTELTQISGFYVTIDDLVNDLDAVTAALRELESGSVVMLELKSIQGKFLYSTNTGISVSEQVDVEAIDALIAGLAKADYYLIAKVPALRDRAFGLENVPCGLDSSLGAYLWQDDQNCYWLDPTKSGTMEYLMDIAGELEALGFDEVVFTEFRFPNTENIIFNGDRSQAIAQAAEQMVLACASDTFAVSFQSGSTAFPLPQGRSRLYLTGVEPADIQSAAEATAAADKTVNLVFVTDSYDTRFNETSTMRPLPMAR